MGSSVILSIWQCFVMQEIIYRKPTKKQLRSCLKMIHVRYPKWSQSIVLLVSFFFFRGWIFQLVQNKKKRKGKGKAHAQEKIGYSWKERGEKIACHCGRALEKAMNNKILKSTDENINMNFFMCLLWHTQHFLSSVWSSVCRMSEEEKFMNQFLWYKRLKHFYDVFLCFCETMRVYFI